MVGGVFCWCRSPLHLPLSLKGLSGCVIFDVFFSRTQAVQELARSTLDSPQNTHWRVPVASRIAASVDFVLEFSLVR